MDLWGIVLLALLVGAVSVAFALAVTLVIHSIRWIFNQGRNSARKRSCTITLLSANEPGATSQIKEIAERRCRPAPSPKG
jgi:hypothetical protein